MYIFHVNVTGWPKDAYVLYNQQPSAVSFYSAKHSFGCNGISGLRPFYVIFPISCGRKPDVGGPHAGAPGPSPQEQATFLVGRDSAHMSMGTVPCYFPILPVITSRLETARQEGQECYYFDGPQNTVPTSDPQVSLWNQQLGTMHTGCRHLALVISHFVFLRQLKYGLSSVMSRTRWGPLSRGYYDEEHTEWNVPASFTSRPFCKVLCLLCQKNNNRRFKISFPN